MTQKKSNENVIVSVPQFIQLIDEHYWSDLGWVFRGQDNIDWPLLPKAGRKEFYLKATEYWEEKGQTSRDLGRFKVWRDNAVAYSNTLPENDFESEVRPTLWISHKVTRLVKKPISCPVFCRRDERRNGRCGGLSLSSRDH